MVNMLRERAYLNFLGKNIYCNLQNKSKVQVHTPHIADMTNKVIFLVHRSHMNMNQIFMSHGYVF